MRAGRKHHEAHLPAVPPGPQTPSRLPLAHGDAGRARRSAPPPPKGPQEAVGLSGEPDLAADATGNAASEPVPLSVSPQPLSPLSVAPQPVPPLRVERLRERADFLALRSGLKAHGSLFTVQVSREPRAESDAVRVGLTVTKKVGNAVERNRIKRRLRHAVRDALARSDAAPEGEAAALPLHGRDVAVIARRDVLHAPYPVLIDALRGALGDALTARTRPRRARETKASRRAERPARTHGGDGPSP